MYGYKSFFVHENMSGNAKHEQM